MLELIFYQ